MDSGSFPLIPSFNPRPPPERGATHSGEPTRTGRLCFNPRPPPERGATLCAALERLHRRGVSIHAPLRREERPVPTSPTEEELQFQSTPPSGERSDAAAAVNPGGSGLFQSTPPSGERSDISVGDFMVLPARFQSTPPSGERSDRPND